MKCEWTAEEVIRATRGDCLHEQSWIANYVTIDSRTVKNGDLFLALEGPSLDGHDYVAEAFAKGAAAAIVHRKPTQTPANMPLVYVDDTFTALQDLGRVGRQRTKATILAVTGSVGKTTSKEQLRTLLNAVGDAYANEGSFNNHWGVPLSLARLPADADYGIFEMGMNHSGELTPLTKEVQPLVSLITNVEAVHLENFSSMESIAEAKAEIFLGQPPEGITVINRDNAYYGQLLAAARTQGLRHILSFGTHPKADARLVDFTPEEDGSKVTADIMGTLVTYRIATPGKHIAFNSLGTLLAATAAGADPVICAEALSSFRPLNRRGMKQKVDLGDGKSLYIIDETFNASPVATEAAINLLGQRPVPQGGRRIVALGEMRELGPRAPEFHAGLANALQNAKIDRVYCCEDLMKHLFDALPPSMRGHYTPTSADLAPLVAAEVRANDVVMVKGSKSVHMENVVNAIKALGQNNT